MKTVKNQVTKQSSNILANSNIQKYLNIAFIYAIASMVSGIFYREFTKLNSFSGGTTLSNLHVHLFVLGFVVFLIVALFALHFELEKQKTFKIFMITYNVGVVLTTAMLIVRGIQQVLGLTLSSGAGIAISVASGIAHIVIGFGLVMLMVSLKKAVNAKKQ